MKTASGLGSEAVFLLGALLANRCVVLGSVAVTRSGVSFFSQSRCRVSTRAKRPGGQGSRLLRTTRSSPDPIHDPAPSKALGLKANPAFGRADISGCSGAVHGSRSLAATIFNRHAAGLGDWLARSPRSESTAHGSDRFSGAFYGATSNNILARLAGVVTGKRAAARQVNATTGSGRWRAFGGCGVFRRGNYNFVVTFLCVPSSG
jgi:hypothetical protein